MRIGFHQCPAPECEQVISNRLFACLPHWRQLSYGTQQAIYVTASMPVVVPERMEAIRRAAREWERKARS